MAAEKRGRGRPRKDSSNIDVASIIPAIAHVASDAMLRSGVVSDKKEVIHNDNWENSLVGLNQIQDKTIHTHYGNTDILDDGTLTELYTGDGLAARIINIIADDMTREWIWITDDNTRSVLDDPIHMLGLEEAVNTVLRWRRLYGGALLIMGIDDGNTMDKPLDENKIKSIKYFRPVDKTCIDLGASTWDEDPMSDRFGKVTLYKIRYTVHDTVIDMDIHYSRVIEFHNESFPVGRFKNIDYVRAYWGMPSLQTVYESLKSLGAVSQSVENILYDFVSGVYKLKGLGQLLAQDADGTAKSELTKRFDAINMSKSMINGIILDADQESYTKNYTTVSGLPELIDRFMLQLSGSTGIPVTRLYGRSPAGLNATGEADIRNYYDIIEAEQRNRLYTQLFRIIRLMCIWKGLDPKTAVFTFNSLYQLTEIEKTQIEKDEATTEQTRVNTQITLINNNLRDPVAVAKALGYGEEMPDDIGEPSEEALNSGDNPVNE
jgi:phage-related protein (TIGR01555 family)